MELINNYEKRKNDIESFYEILCFIDKVETHKNRPLIDANDKNNNIIISRDMQKCMRAETFIILYNAIESTINNCIRLIYDAIQDENLKYVDLSKSLRKIWIKTHYDGNVLKDDKLCEIAFKIAEDSINSQICINNLPNTSGNLDLRKIIFISKLFEINLGKIPNYSRTSEILLSIKNKRNDLAHGNKSFSEIGALVTINDIKEAKDTVIIFLNHVINIYQKYVNKKLYKKNPDNKYKK